MNLPQKLQPNLIQSQKYLQAKKSCSLLLSVHDELIKENAEVEPLLASPSSVQVRSYLSELPTSRSENALAYWSIKKDCFTALAQLVRANLSSTSTSVESERLFSLAGHVVDERRNRLIGDKVDMLLFVKKNLAQLYVQRLFLPFSSHRAHYIVKVKRSCFALIYFLFIKEY